MSFFKRLAVLAVVLLSGLGAGLAVATPAAAADPCPQGILCWYTYSNWSSPKYMVATGTVSPNTCYNMGTDPNTGINWNDRIDSVWFNNFILSTTHVTFFGNPGCSSPNAYVTQAWANGRSGDQMRSCTNAWGTWNGLCGGVGSNRISSWKLVY